MYRMTLLTKCIYYIGLCNMNPLVDLQPSLLCTDSITIVEIVLILIVVDLL